MYQPPDQIISKMPSIRALIVGAPSTGKTHFARTFPNTYFYDLDHKLPVGTPSAPWWSVEWVDAMAAKRWNILRTNKINPPNRRDLLKKYLSEEIDKFTEDQTLVFDGWSALQGYFDDQAEIDIPRPWTNDSSFRFWREKSKFSKDICEIFKRAKCRVIVTMHEQHLIDKKTNLPTDKLKPFQQGSFAHEMAGNFTDVYRTVTDPYVVDPKTQQFVVKRGHYLQLLSDEYFDCGCNPDMSRIVEQQNIKYIENTYEAWSRLLTPSIK